MVPVGAYGFKINSEVDLSRWLIKAPDPWPSIHLDVQTGQPENLPEEDEVLEEVARFPFENGGLLTVDARSSSALLRSPNEVAPDALLHPGLALVAAVFSRWRLEESFHAGAFIKDGKAWGVCGDRGTGKSTLLATLARRGIPVISDDLLVIRNGTGLAGPRCIDLREGNPAIPVDAEPARYGDRSRILLAPCPPATPMGGWILLETANDVSISSIPPHERLKELAAHRYWLLPTNAPAAFLDSAVLPMYRLGRPHDWERQDEGIDALLSI